MLCSISYAYVSNILSLVYLVYIYCILCVTVITLSLVPYHVLIVLDITYILMDNYQAYIVYCAVTMPRDYHAVIIPSYDIFNYAFTWSTCENLWTMRSQKQMEPWQPFIVETGYYKPSYQQNNASLQYFHKHFGVIYTRGKTQSHCILNHSSNRFPLHAILESLYSLGFV